MQLTFEHTQNIGQGTQPSAIHTPENVVQVLYVTGDNGMIHAMDASTPMGAWANREFNPSYLVCADVDVVHMKLKYISASSIFVAWRNETEDGEPTPTSPHNLRHRLAVWSMRQDLSKYLRGGTIELREDDPVSRITLEFENPGQIVSDERDTILTPGAALLLFFRSGDSARYPMGRYFVDRNSMGVTAETTRTEGRGLIGKLLADQTFDEENAFEYQPIQDFFTAILESFDVTNFWVAEADTSRGMEFPPDMDGLTGILEALKTRSKWRIKEDLSGTIGIGRFNDSRFTQPSTYTFQRGSEVFSRDIIREDEPAYSRVCVHNDDRSIEVYRTVDFRFTMARKKTRHVPIAEGTSLADAQDYADELAALYAAVGVIETFEGPFRPHITEGDSARIQGPGSRLLGVITWVKHDFGEFKTHFTVDSGGVRGRARIKDYIEKISGRQRATQSVTRLY